MIFRFKEFELHQEKSAMKLGTDAMLIATWANLKDSPDSILDIGSGTGILALILAQRSQATAIDGVEIEPLAYQECVENFERSPWSDRLFCYNSSFSDFTKEITLEGETYELIITNPPYHTESSQNANNERNLARNEKSLPFNTLLSGVSKLLAPEGIFCVIIPFAALDEFKSTAKKENLFLNRSCEVKGKKTKIPNRILLEFSRKESVIKKEILIVRDETNSYSNQYKKLTNEFYLNH